MGESPEYLYKLGNGYYHGKNDCPQDFAKAKEYLVRAASQGHSKAQNDLGFMYNNGLGGVPQDLPKAFQLFSLSSEQGYCVAQRNLGVMYQNGQGTQVNPRKAFELYQLAADQEDIEGMRNLGALYLNGIGVQRNFALALQWSKRAADEDDAPAQRNMGIMYEKGQGLPQDYYQASEWYQLAANQDHTGALFGLGVLYHNGYGVKQNYKMAHDYYSRATDRPGAHYNLAIILELGQGGVPKDYAKAFRGYRSGAGSGIIAANYFLGSMLQRGLGMPADPKKAKIYFTEALKDKEGLFKLASFFETGTVVSQNVGRAKAIYLMLAAAGHQESLAKVNIFDEILDCHSAIQAKYESS